MRRIACSVLATGLVVTPVGNAQAESFGISLFARIPVICTINHVGTPAADSANAVNLGSLREYCNAPGGYALVVNYAPGTMRGARITAGENQIVLDGSGQTVVGRSTRPRIREISLTATPGENGFDTDRLEFRLDPTGA
jgi:hypothetical protein